MHTQQLHKAQAQAEQERQLLGSVLTQAPVAIGVFQGDELVVTHANDRLCALWGYVPAQVLGKPLLASVPELGGQGFDELIRQVGRTRVPFVGTEVPTEMRGANGRLGTHYFNFVYQPLYGPDGELLGVLDIATDVTGQVQSRHQAEALQAEMVAAAERRARERETFFQVFEQTPASIVLLSGPEHRVEYHNQAYQALFPGRQMRGRTIADIQPDAAEQGFVALLDGVYQTGETFFGRELQLDIDQPDGTRKETYFNFTYQAYRENDQVTGVSVFAYDVTEQVRARQEREAQQRQLVEVFEQAPVAIFVLRGAEYAYEVVNPVMGEMLGTAPGQLLGRRFFDQFPALAAQGYRALLDQVWHSGREYVAREQAAQLPHHREGETGYYNFTYVPLREAQGSVTGIMCVAVDVTAQVLARQQLQALNEELATTSQELAAANEELRAANEEIQSTNEELTESNGQLLRTNADLDNFIYTASHDLKAPIANIEGLLLVLKRHLSPETLQQEPVRGINEMIASSVERFKKTIANLTDITRLQKENGQAPSWVELPEMISEILLDLTPLIEETKAQVQVDVAGCPAISFQEKNLRSILYNLLSNALKYRSPEREPRVQVGCQPLPGYLLLWVSDNGLGIDLSKEQKVFAMFGRLHTHVEGSGMGLYMVKKILDNAGGKIEVESKVGVGSTFKVYFKR